MAETEKNCPDAVHDHKYTVATTNAKNPAMDDGLFSRELDYQASMSIAERLLRQGLMTTGEAHKAKVILLAKYRPLIGELLAEAG